jgi:DNA-binding response OmpR family regulator
MKRLLMIDDDEKLVSLVRKYLEPHGFEVENAYDGEAGLATACEREPALVILDLMLPGLDGLEVCRRLREQSRVPVLMLTASGDETDRIVGLELGADDYLPKPFNPRELLARIRAILRRSQDFSTGGSVSVLPSGSVLWRSIRQPERYPLPAKR